MLSLSFLLLTAAALIGGILSASHLKGGRPAWPWGALHGVVATLGLVTLLLALRGPPRGVAMGVASFGVIAAGLAGTALLVGLGILLARTRRRQVAGLLIGVHATVAIAAVVILAAYALMG